MQGLTGDVRSAGTPCGATLVLLGDDGQTKGIPLGDSALTGACPSRVGVGWGEPPAHRATPPALSLAPL